MAVAVQRDLMACGCDLGGQRGKALDLLADEEEGRDRLGAGERLEHCRRALRMRAVVEGERNAVCMREPQRDLERPREDRRDRSGSRSCPGRRA